MENYPYIVSHDLIECVKMTLEIGFAFMVSFIILLVLGIIK